MAFTSNRVALGAGCLVLSLATAEAQMTHRLKGSLHTEAGAPVASASVKARALSGFRGEPFAGVDQLNPGKYLS